MGKTYVRVDDRLIHGQIVTAWCATLGVEEIIAIDDALAANPMMQSIMTMGVPAQFRPKIVTTEQARELLQQETARTRLVITRFCKNLTELHDVLQNAEHVNIGNCSKQPDERFAVRGIGVSQVLSFTQADAGALDALERSGVPVIWQTLPRDKLRTWAEIKAMF